MEPKKIDTARRVRLSAVLNHLCVYHKQGLEFEPLEPGSKSVRVNVNYQGRDFRFILTGEKWLNELLPQGSPGRGGGGAIDFVRHITDFNFVQAVKACLDALPAK